MKKIISVLGIISVLLLMGFQTAFADAASYDMKQAGYYVYVATPDGGLNMREGPGTNYSKVMKERIPDGVRLYIELVSDNWGYTTYNGNYGWVALKQTTKNPPAKAEYTTKAAGYYVYVATPDGGLNMRQGPGTGYNKVTENRIPDDVKLYIESVSGDWGYTSYNGNSGCVYLGQTTKVPPKSDTIVKEENTEAPVEVSINDEKVETSEPEVTETDEPEENELGENEIEEIRNSISTELILVIVLVALVIAIALLVLILIKMKK